MRIFIANPPFFRSFNRQVRWAAKTSGGLHPPIYLAYAAAVLAKSHQVKLVDGVALDMSREAFLKEAAAFNPDLVVMETSTPSIVNDSALAQEMKKVKDVPVAFTGSHVSALPERTLRETPADFAAIGEYDHTLRELAETLEGKGDLSRVNGIAYKDKGQIRVNPRRELIKNLDEIPWPLREQLPNERYSDTLMTSPLTFIVSARGCPYQCTYCSWPSTMFGHPLRERDPMNVVDEIEFCVKKYRLKSFKIFDDTFTANKPRVKAICNELIKRKVVTPWICNARVDNLDEETMRLMKKAGCYLFKLGLESGNQDILDWVKKGTKIQQIRDFVKTAKKVGISTFGSFMIGYPMETEETIRQTFELAKSVEPDMVQFVILQPLPGTELWGWMERNQMIPKDVKWDNYITKEGYVDLVFKHPKFSQDELREICHRLWKGYYLRKGYIARRALKGLRSPREIKRNVAGVKKIFRYKKV